jgi:hypothetical protein
MFYQTTLIPPHRRAPEDYSFWVCLGVAQAAVVVLALLRRRGLR